MKKKRFLLPVLCLLLPLALMISALAAGGDLSVKDIVARIEGNPDEALAAIKRLLANGSIRMSDDGTVSVPKR